MKKNRSKKILLAGLSLCGLVILLLMGSSIAFAAQGGNMVSTAAIAAPTDTSATGLGYIGVAISTGLAAAGAGIGVGIAGASAIGAISEKPELLGRTLIYIGLAEGVAIYGLIISIMILGRL